MIRHGVGLGGGGGGWRGRRLSRVLDSASGERGRLRLGGRGVEELGGGVGEGAADAAWVSIGVVGGRGGGTGRVGGGGGLGLVGMVMGGGVRLRSLPPRLVAGKVKVLGLVGVAAGDDDEGGVGVGLRCLLLCLVLGLKMRAVSLRPAFVAAKVMARSRVGRGEVDVKGCGHRTGWGDGLVAVVVWRLVGDGGGGGEGGLAGWVGGGEGLG